MISANFSESDWLGGATRRVRSWAAGLGAVAAFAVAADGLADGLAGKVMCGYQGWFRVEGDGTGNGWHHYAAGQPFAPGHSTIDLWPDVRALPEADQFSTSFRHPDGSVAKVFSSARPTTIRVHFNWMREYGIDGVFLQRFGVSTLDPRFRGPMDTVLEGVRASAGETGRLWVLMYDLSGMRAGSLHAVMEDWRHLRRTFGIAEGGSDRAYLRHRDKPLVALWGLGFNDRPALLDEWRTLIEFFKSDEALPGGCSVMLGVPAYWRSLDRDAIDDPALHDLIARAEVVSPWTVGRYDSPAAAARHAATTLSGDIAWCRDRGLDYLPVAFPGFSWHNLSATRGQTAALDAIPRLGGRFFWSQCVHARRAGAEALYVAMFDELDEATAIFKVRQDPPVGASRFVSEPDIPGDHYLWLTGMAGDLMRSPVDQADEAMPERSPAAMLEGFTTDPALEIELAAAEPSVTQPVYLTFDPRGRLWVVQYRQYPFPAGLKVVGHDEYWRVQYDAFPPPAPPNHPRGADKVTIFEDRDGDGKFETTKDFVTGLNITTAALPGHQGVWIMNPPYLLFYPDADGDDRPDGDPVVHLAGFGLEDMHAVANGLAWGPDGWIYGCQGSTCTATVTRPGLDDPGLHFKGQAIWRYHPESRRFELFAEGGWNNFALAPDEQWQLFTGSNGGIIGVHYVQGGYYRKHFPKHGPFTNPFTFGHVEGMRDHSSKAKLSQAMAFCTADGWPADFRHGVLVARVLQQRIDLCEFVPDGSSYAAHERRVALASSDASFRPVDLKIGPDGAAYIADWHEPNVTWNVTAGEGGLRTDTGRIYRLKPRGLPRAAPVDFTALTGPQLIDSLRHPNQWHRDTARRILRDRGDRSLVPALVTLVHGAAGQLALEALWALHACGGFTADQVAPLLSHPEPSVRRWAVRLLGDEEAMPRDHAAAIARLARTEQDAQVRSQIASTARRLDAAAARPIVEALVAHAEDVDDPNIPLLVWYAVEQALRTDPLPTRQWLESSPLWEAPVFRSAIVHRLGQRFTVDRSEDALRVCARLLTIAPDLEQKRTLLRGMAMGLAGNTVDTIPVELEHAIRPLWTAGPPDTDLVEVAVRLGSREAAALAADRAGDATAPEPDRLTLLRLLADRRDPQALAPALAMLHDAASPAMRQEALAAAQSIGGDSVGPAILDQALRHDDAWKIRCLTVLSSRPAWALALLEAVEAGTLAVDQVPRDIVLALRSSVGAPHADRLTRLWGTLNQTPEIKKARLAELSAALAAAPGDPEKGHELFALLCASCHTLHHHGRGTGPDLTGIDRGDRDSLLHSIVDPSASILPDFMAFELALHPRANEDARTLVGFIQEESTNGLVVVDAAGTRTAVAARDIAHRSALPISLMPEGLLDSLTHAQIRDLIAWIQSNPETP